MKKLKRITSLILCLIMAVSVAGLQISASADEQKTTVYKFSAGNAAWSKTEGCNPNNGWAWGSFATTSFTYSEDGEALVNVTAGAYDKFRQFNSNWNNVPATTQSAYIDITNNSTRTIKVKIATAGYTTPADADLPTVESGKTINLELGTLTGGSMQIMLQDISGSDSIVCADSLFKLSPVYTLSTTDPGTQPELKNESVFNFSGLKHNWSKTEGWNNVANSWGSFATTTFTYNDGSANVNVVNGTFDKFRQLNSNWNNVPATTQTAYIDITNNSNRPIKIKIYTPGYTTPADSSLPYLAKDKTYTIELGTLTGGTLQIMLLDADGSDAILNGENIFTFSPIYIKVEKQPIVTIDGTEYELTDGNFTFPENTNADFVGYSDGEKLYAAGETISVDKSISVTTMTLSLSMKSGAAIRYADPSGLRFYTNIDTVELGMLETMGATVQLGTLVSREDIIGEEALTFDMSGKILNIPYNAREWYTEGDFSGFVGSIVRFKEHNLNNKFAGRGYAKITLGEFSKTIYATYPSDDINNLLRSVCFVANSVKNDTAVYNALTDGQKTIIDNYVAKYVAE